MATAGGPNLVDDGLVLALDAANIKSFRGEPTTNIKIDSQTSRFGYGTGAYSWHGLQTEGEYAGWYKMTATSTNSSNFLIMGLRGINAIYNRTYTASIEFISPNNSLSFHLTGNSGVGQALPISGQPNRYYRTFTKSRRDGYQHWYLRTKNGSIGSISNGIIYYRNIQWEEKSYPTRFTTGTRGTTVANGGGWKDMSGNNNHGEILNGTSTSNKKTIQEALEFDGVNDYTIADLPSINSAHTVMLWIYANNGLPTITGSSTGRVTPLKGNGHWNPGIWLGNNKIRGHAATIYSDYTNINWTEPAWHLIGQVYDGSNLNLIVDGDVVTPTSTTSYSPGIPSEVLIGIENIGTSTTAFNGKIAKVQIYNRALTSQEVQQNYNATKGRFGL